VLAISPKLYAAFSNSTGTGAEVIELRPDQHSE
jgi:hypothetical protein